MSNLFQAGGTVISIYPTPEHMRDKVDEYFDMCFVKVWSKTYNREVEKCIKPPTWSGLARYLGFGSRAQMLNYTNARDEAYTEVMNKAKLRIEEYLEGELVHAKAPNGIMFSLKNNAGWEDKTKQQITGDDDKPLVFGWSSNAADVIDVGVSDAENKEGVLPTPPLQIESTSTSEVVE